MKDKFDQLLDVLENPDRYSEDELNVLINDQEIKEIYDAITKTADSVAEPPIVDVDEEWEKFSQSHFRFKLLDYFSGLSGLISRNVAVVTLLIVASAILAATVGFSYSIKTNRVTETGETIKETTVERSIAGPTDTVKEGASQNSDCEVVVFKNKTLENILGDISLYYEKSVVFKSSGSKNLRLYFQWDQALPLEDVIGQLNSFESIDVKLFDNEIIVD